MKPVYLGELFVMWPWKYSAVFRSPSVNALIDFYFKNIFTLPLKVLIDLLIEISGLPPVHI